MNALWGLSSGPQALGQPGCEDTPRAASSGQAFSPPFHLPEGPGLGVEIDHDAVEKFTRR